MSDLVYYSYEGAGEWLRDNFKFNQAVRIENKIEIAGQGKTHSPGCGLDANHELMLPY
jgi:hypothetical protein